MNGCRNRLLFQSDVRGYPSEYRFPSQVISYCNFGIETRKDGSPEVRRVREVFVFFLAFKKEIISAK